MLTRAANWSWTGKTQGIRARIPLIGCIETALGPTLTVLTLVVCAIWLEVDFGLQYVLLSLLAFLLLFPASSVSPRAAPACLAARSAHGLPFA